jgi:predicted ATP-grasp superfamily ATP-dependent carboligase
VVLRRVRRPEQVAEVLRSAGLPVPAICRRADDLPARGRWLIKPLAGSGGSGIRFFRRGGPPPRGPVYFQQFIDGQPLSAVYVAGVDQTRLLGVTRQLVGQDWLHAQPFHYCGSIGPVALARRTRETFVRIGAVLSSAFGLRGLFGVDCLLRDGIPWPIEVNPRYPASVEVLELACGVPALALHRRVFEPNTPATGGSGRKRRGRVLGKAICFAQSTFSFPAEGPWSRLLDRPPDPWEWPHFADVPPAGEVIRAGRPILTFFAAADSVARCLAELKRQARELNQIFARSLMGNY